MSESLLTCRLRSPKDKKTGNHEHVSLSTDKFPQTLLLQEQLLQLRTDILDKFINYDSDFLVHKLQQCLRHHPVVPSESAAFSLVTFGQQTILDLLSSIQPLSPVLSIYSRYRSCGYPWNVGFIDSCRPRLVICLAVRWLELTSVDGEEISTFAETNLEDAEIDPVTFSSPQFVSEHSNISSPGTPICRRWPLSYVDPYGQWRLLALTPHSDKCLYAAIGYSNGLIEIIDLATSPENIANKIRKHPRIIISPLRAHLDFAPLVGLHFLRDPSHLLVCRFSGHLELWRIDASKDSYPAHLLCRMHLDELVLKNLHWRNVLPFLGSFANPILSFAFEPNRQLLVVGGECASRGKDLHRDGLSVVAVDINAPFFFSPPGVDWPKHAINRVPRVLSLMHFTKAYWRRDCTDAFLTLSLSSQHVCPGTRSFGDLLAAVHCSMSVTVWSFPGCNLLANILPDTIPAAVKADNLSTVLAQSNLPFRICWWRRVQNDSKETDISPFSDLLLAILKNDGTLSAIDVFSMENQLLLSSFGGNSEADSNVLFAPFPAFACRSSASDGATELIILNCSSRSSLSKQGVDSELSHQLSMLKRFSLGLECFFSAFGLTNASPRTLADADSPLSSLPTTPMTISVIRLAATSASELFMHRLRSGLYLEARLLATAHKLDLEMVYQHKWLANFQKNASSSLNYADFVCLVKECLCLISQRVNWVLAECLHKLPVVSDSWTAVEFFDAVTLLLNTGLSMSKTRRLQEAFEERLYHVQVLVAIFAEECALSLGPESRTDTHLKSAELWSRELLAFRHNSAMDIALFYLHSRRYAACSVLIRHFSLLLPNLLGMLTSLPVTESPSDYSGLIKICLGGFSVTSDPPVFRQDQLDDAIIRLYSRIPEVYLRYKNLSQPISARDLASWVRLRATEIDAQSGLVTNARELVDIVSALFVDRAVENEEAFKSVDFLKHELDQFEMVLFSTMGYDISKSLRRKLHLTENRVILLSRLKFSEFCRLPLDQRLNLLTCLTLPRGSNVLGSEVHTAVMQHLLPFIREQFAGHEDLQSICVGCFRRVAERCGLQFAVFILESRQQKSEQQLQFKIENSLSKEELAVCILEMLCQYTPVERGNVDAGLNCEPPMLSYLHHCQKILRHLEEDCRNSENVAFIGRVRQLSRFSSTLLFLLEEMTKRHLVERAFSDLGLGVRSLAEVIQLQHDEIRLRGLISRWIRLLLRYREELNSVNYNASTMLSPVTGFAGRIVARREHAEASASNTADKLLSDFFEVLSGCLIQLTTTEERVTEDKRVSVSCHLLIGLLCSGDEQLIRLAAASLRPKAQDQWQDALKFAIQSYLDATANYGIRDHNEAMARLCLEYWQDLSHGDNRPVLCEEVFLGAMTFLASIDRDISRLQGDKTRTLFASREHRSLWSSGSVNRKHLLQSAIGSLFEAIISSSNSLFPYSSALVGQLPSQWRAPNLLRYGVHFGLDEIEVKRCFLMAVFDVCLRHSERIFESTRSRELLEQAIVFLRELLTERCSSAWPEVAVWASGCVFMSSVDLLACGSDLKLRPNLLYTLFRLPNTLEFSIERFRLTLTRFAITFSILDAHSASFQQHRLLTNLLLKTSLFVAKASQSKPCTFQVLFLTPLSPNVGEFDLDLNYRPRTVCTPLFEAWTSGETDFDHSLVDTDLSSIWLDCLVEHTWTHPDVALVYAYGPPLGKKKHWTRDVGTYLSKQYQIEEFRLQAVCVAASSRYPVTHAHVLPPPEYLQSTLNRISAKHNAVKCWRSRLLVSRLLPPEYTAVAHSDTESRLQRLIRLADDNLMLALVIAKNAGESRTSIILASFTEAVFSPETGIKRRLKLISPYLKSEVTIEQLKTYLSNVLSCRIRSHGVSLNVLLLVVKVCMIMLCAGSTEASLCGIPVARHLRFLSVLVPKHQTAFDSIAYLCLLEALTVENQDVMHVIDPYLTSERQVQAVSCLISAVARESAADGRPLMVPADTLLYKALATRFLIADSESALQDCMNCFPLMIMQEGESAADLDLVDWVKVNLFGKDSCKLGLFNRIRLIDAAVDAVNEQHRSESRLINFQRHLKSLPQVLTPLEEYMSNDLFQQFAVHDCSDLDETRRLVLASSRELLGANGTLSSTSLTSFLQLLETSAVAVGLSEQKLLAFDIFSECINTFMVRLLDWILDLESDEPSHLSLLWTDLEAHMIRLCFDDSDRFIYSSWLIAWPRVRQLVGSNLLTHCQRRGFAAAEVMVRSVCKIFCDRFRPLTVEPNWEPVNELLNFFTDTSDGCLISGDDDRCLDKILESNLCYFDSEDDAFRTVCFTVEVICLVFEYLADQQVSERRRYWAWRCLLRHLTMPSKSPVATAEFFADHVHFGTADNQLAKAAADLFCLRPFDFSPCFSNLLSIIMCVGDSDLISSVLSGLSATTFVSVNNLSAPACRRFVAKCTDLWLSLGANHLLFLRGVSGLLEGLRDGLGHRYLPLIRRVLRKLVGNAEMWPVAVLFIRALHHDLGRRQTSMQEIVQLVYQQLL